jgi:hypothetical protein
LEAGKVEIKIEKVAATGISDPKPIINAAGPSSAAANKKLQEGKKVCNADCAKLAPTSESSLLFVDVLLILSQGTVVHQHGECGLITESEPVLLPVLVSVLSAVVCGAWAEGETASPAQHTTAPCKAAHIALNSTHQAPAFPS